MQFNAQIAAAILGFVSVSAAHQHQHQHAHHHEKRQFLEEKPNGQVGWSAPASGGNQWQSSTTPAGNQWQPSTTSTTWPTLSSQAAGSSQATPTPAPSWGGQSSASQQTTMMTSTQSATGSEQTGGDLTINVINKYGSPLSLVYGNNAGGPSANGNPQDGMLASSTQVTFPTGWAGRMTIGKDGNAAGSKIEGSFFDLPDIDISYVDGYSVPITCSCAGSPVTGCNLELFDIGSCETKQGDTCINTISGPDPNGPAMPFFAPCQGAAYTYPNDNDANVGCQSTVMDCCIGTNCDAPSRQKVAGNSSNNQRKRR